MSTQTDPNPYSLPQSQLDDYENPYDAGGGASSNDAASAPEKAGASADLSNPYSRAGDGTMADTNSDTTQTTAERRDTSAPENPYDKDAPRKQTSSFTTTPLGVNDSGTPDKTGGQSDTWKAVKDKDQEIADYKKSQGSLLGSMAGVFKGTGSRLAVLRELQQERDELVKEAMYSDNRKGSEPVGKVQYVTKPDGTRHAMQPTRSGGMIDMGESMSPQEAAARARTTRNTALLKQPIQTDETGTAFREDPENPGNMLPVTTTKPGAPIQGPIMPNPKTGLSPSLGNAPATKVPFTPMPKEPPAKKVVESKQLFDKDNNLVGFDDFDASTGQHKFTPAPAAATRLAKGGAGGAAKDWTPPEIAKFSEKLDKDMDALQKGDAYQMMVLKDPVKAQAYLESEKKKRVERAGLVEDERGALVPNRGANQTAKQTGFPPKGTKHNFKSKKTGALEPFVSDGKKWVKAMGQ